MKKNTFINRQLVCLCAIAAASSLAACSDDAGSNSNNCQKGSTQSCVCSDGSQGSQTCTGGNEGWAECVCTPSSNTITDNTAEACKNATCGEHGSCAVTLDGAGCICRDGYISSLTTDNNPTCKAPDATSSSTPADDDVCKDITCSDHGACTATTKGPRCICDAGYEPGISGSTPVCNQSSSSPTDITPTTDPCADIDCTDNGICTVKNGTATCICTGEYEMGLGQDNNITCVPKSNVCDGITCDNKGACINVGGTPSCLCTDSEHYQPGFDANGKPTCVEKTSPQTDGPCKGITCNDHGTCVTTGSDTPLCVCASGYHQGDTPTSCVQDSALTNPCTGQTCSDHGICLVTGNNTPYCLCEDGYANNGNTACEPKSVVSNDSVCKDVTCSDHGTCVIAGDNTPLCICNEGYINETKTSCKEETGTKPAESVCKDVTCSGHGTCLVTGDNTPLCICEYNYKNDGAVKCVSAGSSEGHSYAYPTEATDPWGLIWDSQERPPQTHFNAVATCESIGGRLPTPTEIIRNNHTTGYKGIGDISNTNALWTYSMGPSGADYIETLPLSTGALGQTHRNTPAPFRCVWPKESPALFTGQNCHSTPQDLKDGKSCQTIDIGKIKYSIDSVTRPAQYYFEAMEECYKAGGRLPTYLELIQLMTHNAFSANEDWMWTEFINGYHGVVNWNNTTKAYTISYSSWNTPRTFRCVSEQVQNVDGVPTFPQTKANNPAKIIEITPQLRIDANPRTKDSTWNAIYDCMNDGGRLASYDEMYVAIRTGKVPVPTTEILTSSPWNNGSMYFNKWAAFVAPYYMPSGGATALTTTFPYYCSYRPARDFDYTNIEAKVTEGKAAKYSDNDDKVNYYIYKKTDLTSGAVITVSDSYAENEGTYLPTYGDILFAIRKGMTTIYTSDTLITSTPNDGGFAVRTVNWSGTGNPSTTPTLGSIAYTTSTSTSRSFLSTTVR